MGVRVGGLFGPKAVPLAPLPVPKVEKILLPPGCMPEEVDLGSPPPCANFSQGFPHMLDVVCGLRPKIC